MTKLEIYDQLFIRNFRVKKEDLPGLKYRGIENWESLGHMELIADIEEKFDIHMSTPDIMEFSSYEMGKEVLKKYGVVIE